MLLLDIVQSLTTAGVASNEIPAKIEGIAFGPHVQQGAKSYHTLCVSNDNDFLETVPDANGNMLPNPNQFFVCGFTNSDPGGSTLVPQKFEKRGW